MSHRLSSEGNTLTTNYYYLSFIEAGRCRRHFTLSHDHLSYGWGDQGARWHQELPLLLASVLPGDLLQRNPPVSLLPPSLLTSPSARHSFSSRFSPAAPGRSPPAPAIPQLQQPSSGTTIPGDGGCCKRPKSNVHRGGWPLVPHARLEGESSLWSPWLRRSRVGRCLGTLAHRCYRFTGGREILGTD